MVYPWSKSVFPIAAIFSFRILGLFMLLPVFTVYAADLRGATPLLIGMALGFYGLTQGLLQLPFGMLSDRFGRKPIITLGLFFFALGSLIGALTDSIYGMILARGLQGAGAVGSVLIALLTDLTPEDKQPKAMAVLGVSIGLSFGLAMLLSPSLSRNFGLSGLFNLTLLLISFSLFLLHAVIPKTVDHALPKAPIASLAQLRSLIANRQLIYLNLGIFCLHFILMSTFFEIPMLLKWQLQQGQATELWYFYLPLVLVSFLVMFFLVHLAEKKKLVKTFFLTAILCISLAEMLLIKTHQTWWGLMIPMLIYFSAFNFLEACLPSMISRQAPQQNKGTAMGIYSSCQFLGVFSGGTFAGIVYAWAGDSGIFTINAVIALLWFGIALQFSEEKTDSVEQYSTAVEKPQ